MPSSHTKKGKWSEANVPHKGWICVSDDDLGDDMQICGMCESAEVRFIHYMEHDDYPEQLGVGCICAENMSQDYVGPKIREKALRSRAVSRSNIRKSWHKKNWRVSGSGNYYINLSGYNITVFGAPGNWKIRVTNRTNNNSKWGNAKFMTSTEAKVAACKAFIWAKENL